MTILADMDRKDQFYWLQENAPRVGCLRDELVEALRKYTIGVAKCEGALERTGATAESYFSTIMDAVDSALAEEVRRDLGL